MFIFNSYVLIIFNKFHFYYRQLILNQKLLDNQITIQLFNIQITIRLKIIRLYVK